MIDEYATHGEIYVWESESGWKVVEAWRDRDGCPRGQYVILQDGMRWKAAIDYADRIRKGCALL